MTLIVSGSLAIDRIAEHKGKFSSAILPANLDILNVSFLVESVNVVQGGTAGNIAYNLTFLDEKPLIIGALGGDGEGNRYLERIKRWGLSTEAIQVVNDLPTAGAYIATDESQSQLSFFHSGAMTAPRKGDPLKSLSPNASEHLAIVSPGGLGDMFAMPKLYKEKGIKYIFDPGQQTPLFSKEEFIELLDGSCLLMTNEYELSLVLDKKKLTIDDLLSHTQAIVTTKGEKGSVLTTPEGSLDIQPVKIRKVINSTGAGDAYRAGVLKALYYNKELLSACRLGAAVASFCVEAPGTQEQIFSLHLALEKVRETFGETISF
ncbi:MAG: carbohydrate kinase family protein [Deltaproteobacteria bacterium]|jgi:adenosine kinase|nr:carbohydrate kinase family protein [Deltaproteobacteria bacterium]